MSDTKHTPGPWELGQPEGFHIPVLATGKVCRTVANVLDFDVAKHDAPLIAAAPDLLAVCKLAKEFLSGKAGRLDSPHLNERASIRLKLDQAVSKAEPQPTEDVNAKD